MNRIAIRTLEARIHGSAPRSASAFGLAIGFATLLAIGFAPAQAQQKKAPEKTAAPKASPAKTSPAKANPAKTSPAPAAATGSQAFLIGTFGDWKALMSGKDKQKVCYALSQPKDRKPGKLVRNPAYLFISSRVSDGAKNEVAFKLGFPARFGQDGTAAVGSASFMLVADAKAPNPKEKAAKALPDSSAFLKNPAQEGQLIEAMKKAANLTMKISSARGNETIDTYSLNGLGKALEAVARECP